MFEFTQIAFDFIDNHFKMIDFFVRDTTIVWCWDYYFGSNYKIDKFHVMKLANKFEYFGGHKTKCCKRLLVYQDPHYDCSPGNNISNIVYDEFLYLYIMLYSFG